MREKNIIPKLIKLQSDFNNNLSQNIRYSYNCRNDVLIADRIAEKINQIILEEIEQLERS